MGRLKIKATPYICYLYALWMFLNTKHLYVEGISVTKIWPNYGSLAGETRLTITGEGYSRDQFSENEDPDSGNKVFMVGLTSKSTFSCNVLKDGSTENLIVAYTPDGMPDESYRVVVKVDGTTIKDDDICGGDPTSKKCIYRPTASYTPTITSFSPQSGIPGIVVNMTGKIFSDKYGSNMAAATNERTEAIIRTYAGANDCEMKEGDEFYGLSLEAGDSDYGYLVCKTKGTSVGFYEASFILQAPFGRSLVSGDVERVSYNDKVYTIQLYTELTSISHHSGSTAGGLTLTIYGNYVDDQAPYVAPRAYVGDTECVITKVVSDEFVECTVAADPQYTSSLFPGNRGVTFEYWENTQKSTSNMDDILSMNDSYSGYNIGFLDETIYRDDTMDGFVTRMTTFFTPPHDGEYQLQLMADDAAKLFVDGNEILTSNNAWAYSSRMTLDKNTKYKFEVIHFDNAEDAFVQLRAKFFNTTLTSASTGKAKQELQTVRITSTKVNDVQTLTFNDFNSGRSTNEVQTVEVETPDKFRFGLFNVYTEPFDLASADDTTVTAAFNSLPIFNSDESVAVVRNAGTSSNSATFTVRFTSKRGDFPPIDVVAVDNAKVKHTTTEDTKGSPDKDTVALLFANTVSPPFTVSTLTKSTLETALNSMFEAKCPSLFCERSISKVCNDYETDDGKFTGEMVKDEEPFCGRYSLKNPRRIYNKGEKERGIAVSTYSTLCFAYKGVLSDYIWLRYSYKDSNTDETITRTNVYSHTFNKDSAEMSSTWYYTCFDMKSAIEGTRPSDSGFYVQEIWVSQDTTEIDIYIDTLFIGRQETTTDTEINRRRLPPSMPNGAIMDTVSVTSSGTEYTVTLSAFDCGNKFPLFELANGKVSNGRTSSSSNSATLKLNNGGSEHVKVSRSSEASPPVTGFIDLTFNGNTKTVNVSLEASEFERELESLSGIGGLSVVKNGDCANFDLDVTFLTLSGDLPEMTINDNALKGIDAQGSITTKVDGGVFYDPLTGDMLNTVHAKPQARLYINDVPLKCSGDCNFEWDASVTPAVTSVSPTSGTSALSTSVTISGSGFTASQSGNKVTIGDVACSVTAATATSITCDVGNGPVGAHKVEVTVLGKGNADHTGGDIEFTYTADITSITPTTGSLGGGSLLTINGNGFKSGASVTINSIACKDVAVDADTIQCTIPPNTAGTYDIVVEQGTTTLTHSGYTYDDSLTAKITSVSPSSIGVQGDTVTITGTAFGSTEDSVYVGSQMMTVTSWTDTQIVFETGAMGPGNKDVKVTAGQGYAVDTTGSLPTLNVELEVTNVYPLQGSLQGGTKVTITGSGFGTNDSLVDVNVGVAPCDVSTVANTQIVCTIGQAGRVHTVTNMGTDSDNVYYAFDNPYITIHKGEYVNWKWETPDFVNDVNHCIYEVDSPSSTKAKDGGFACSTPSPNGEFKHQFNQIGTFYVWSGYVDTYEIKNYVGTVQVDDAVAFLEEVSINVAGKEALYTVGGTSDPADSSSCGSVLTSKSGCSETTPSGGNADKFNFAFLKCSTPVITGINKNNGTVSTEITITGNGLSAAECQNEILIGDFACSVTSSSETSVACKMAKAGEPSLGMLLPFSIRVGNRGYARIDVSSITDSSFGLKPSIDSISPITGSKGGGAILTIQGFGFGDSPFVTIDGEECKIGTNTYTQITCVTPMSNAQKNAEIQVTTLVNGNIMPAVCETSSQDCIFAYASARTPTLSSVDPNTMSGSTTFTIKGSFLQASSADITVSIGGSSATLTKVNNTELTATIQNVPAGSHKVVVKVKDYGIASGNVDVLGNLIISSVTPNSGSTYGNTMISITGNGFVEGQTEVLIGGVECNITDVTLGEVKCITPAKAAGDYNLNVTSNGVSASSTYKSDTASTPTVTSVNPTAGLAGSTLSIVGTNLFKTNGGTTVMLDGEACTVTSNTATLIECTIGDHATGSVPVSVEVNGYGASNKDVQFEYQLSLTSIQPTAGGTAGGQTMALAGTGFDETASVSICGNMCAFVSTTTTEYKCKTPTNTAQVCDVSMTINGITRVLASSYTYDASLTPTVTGVSPTRGGTGGGTTITITGTDFGTIVNDVSVTIDGAECVASSVTDTEIECVTGPHLGSIMSTVNVEISGNGIGQENPVGASNFQYIDVWSSSYSWGGASPPGEGEFIVIPKGMTMLLDTDTPVLKFLLIQGGELIFDEKDVELNSEIIMITDGGRLQVGTEAEPFQHKAIITLHGHHRNRELPIYGTKVLAVRNGTLDLHGIEVPMTWTHLAATANAGSTTLTLVNPVEWNVGDEIVIASTGNFNSQSENEKKTINSISGDKMTLTLNSALEASHHGTQETFDGRLVEFRAEVGLLTHNVVVRGNNNAKWQGAIEACEDGFDTGEFATQTCFQGRFGDEIGSSQFGAMILVHAPVKDTHEAQARISYTEVTFAGQAFRLGRYPIHFHLNGDMSTSYVRGCGIHHTFNRAVNIHGTHNTMVEKTVIYNIMGGAFFLEDGIETGNTFQYNLAIFVRESSSLLNDDITPASFWVTNPNNTLQHNTAAGGTHFGFWYRMHDHPDGPSFTTDVCCKNVPLGVFRNNTAHSFGWFGLWIFADYFPLKGGCGGTEVEPAVFSSLFAWNNEKGVEAVMSGALQFMDFVLVQNKLAGYEGKKVLDVPHFTDDSPMIGDSLIIGKTATIPDSTQGCQKGAIVFPYGDGFRVKNVTIVNYADSECVAFRWTRIDGTCSVYCGGYNYHAEGVRYVNAPNKAVFEWSWEGMLIDKDGSVTGQSANGWTVVPTEATLPSDCVAAPEFSKGKAASMCPPQYRFHRYSFNNPLPESLEGKNFLITNQYGTSSVPYAKKRLSHPYGWTCALIDGETYHFAFEFAEQITNISYSGVFSDLQAGDWVAFELTMKTIPDRVSIDAGETYINSTVGLDPATARNGDWEWDDVNQKIKFVVHGTKRSKRGGSMTVYDVDRPMQFTAFKCYYDDCIPPPDKDTIPPAATRPNIFTYWDDMSLWNDTGDGYITSDPERNGTYGIPQALDNVKIVYDEWVVINNTSPAELGTLWLEGVLELIDTPGVSYEVNVELIIIMGGRLVVGWPDEPFQAQASFILRGSHASPLYPIGDGPPITSKSIGVFGGLDLFGKNVNVPWTLLGATANVGDNMIVLKEAVDWVAGNEIVIGPTSYNMWQTESFKITSVAADKMTLTLNDTLQHKHLYSSEILNGKTIELVAAVGLLTRNIKIIGEDYADMYKESFGARVIVGLVATADSTYTGYARLSNVEFYHTGQEGFTEEYDPRFSLAYVATGTVSDIKPSFVTKCAFHSGFNTAIGAFGSGSLNISDNVVFHTVGSAIRSSSEDTRIINNLVALVLFTGAYQGRYEPYNFRWEAGIETMKATKVVMKDNLVTGSERTAYRVHHLSCDDTSGSYINNRAQSSLIGLLVLPDDVLSGDCVMFSGFSIWRTHDFGIHYQNNPSLKLTDIIVSENRHGIYTYVIGPSAVDHVKQDDTVEISNSYVIGTSLTLDCDDYKSPKGNFMKLSSLARPLTAPTGGKIGISFTTFAQGGNAAPTMAFENGMAYPTIGGLMKQINITFAHFDNGCKGDFAVATTKGTDDGQHPVISTGTNWIDVNEDNKIIYHRPNVGKINSADCIDMDCDGLKKALFKDLDGTFLGAAGSVIAQSEYEWDGNPQHGLGNYRVPKDMLTDVNGNKLEISTVAPNQGIIRSNTCTYMSAWQAYKCPDDYNYEMLIIESMDEDTEVRRLSPVAILGDGYMDLINGPQDHGWCSGYTCRKRLSTFMAIVATEKEYVMYFTSTTPLHMRYYLLNSEDTEAIKLSVWYSRPNRLDVYVDNELVMATNARIKNGNYIMDMPKGDEYTPMLANASGTNFVDRNTGLISFIIKGPKRIDVKTRETVVVSFTLPAMTTDTFFGENIIENLAAFLGVSLTKVRIASVVSASGSGRRRRRSSTGVVVLVEIGDEPSSSLNDTVSDSLEHSALLVIASDIVNECQVGSISENFNVSGACNSVEVPTLEAAEELVVYSAQSPVELVFTAAPVPLYEGVALQTQPKVQALDISGVVVSELGTSEYPWQLTVSIRAGTGHPSAVLGGNTTVTASDGWMNFTELTISHMGTGYILDFNVTFPSVAENFTLSSDPFDVASRPLKANVYQTTSGFAVKNSEFTVTLDLRDENTNEIITDIAWRDHTWAVTATVLGSTKYGDISGTTTISFDESSGQALFPDLAITGVGVYYLQYVVVSSPAGFNLTLNQRVAVIDASHVGMVPEDTNEIQVKFDVDYSKVLSTTDKANEFESQMLQEMANLYPNVRLSPGSIREGSIIITFIVDGSVGDVNATAYALCDSVFNNTQYSYGGYTLTLSPYMTINNSTFYGVSCGAIDSDDDDDHDKLHPGIIAAIVIVAVAVLIAVIGLVAWRVCIKPKTKTHNMHNGMTGTHYLGSGGKTTEDVLFREDTFTSMKFNMGGFTPRPPVATKIGHGAYPNEKRPLSGQSIYPSTTQQVLVANLLAPSDPKTQSPSYLNPDSGTVYGGLRAGPSPVPSNTAGTPMLHRGNSAFSDRDSPLPPVGNNTFNSDYITTPTNKLV